MYHLPAKVKDPSPVLHPQTFIYTLRAYFTPGGEGGGTLILGHGRVFPGGVSTVMTSILGNGSLFDTSTQYD